MSRKATGALFCCSLLAALALLISPAGFVLADGNATHVVQSGENLYRIALQYGTTVQQIIELNGLVTTIIVPGQLLVMPKAKLTPTKVPAATPTPIPAPVQIAYVVQKGDNLFRLALQHGTAVSAIQLANGLKTTLIRVGQTLLLPAPTPRPAAPTLHEPDVQWGYHGEQGPENWGHLSSAYEACSAGQSQSPVDIAAPVSIGLTDIKFNYYPVHVSILNNGHTIQANFPTGNSIVVDGTTYELIQLHFHSPGEHTIYGESFDMEMHLVHRDTGGNLAVVGVVMSEGAANPAFDQILEYIPKQVGETLDLPEAVDVSALLPTDQQVYRYPGSLTTPPCSEGVKWILLATPVELSDPQAGTFTALYTGTNRPVQPLHTRLVLLDGTVD